MNRRAITILLLLPGFLAFAQKTYIYTDKDQEFHTGVSLFEKEKYTAAQKSFRAVIKQYGDDHSQVRSDAEYYNAVCAIRLFNPDAEYLITNFLLDYPESPQVKYAYFEMGKFKYRDKKYDEASGWFDKVNRNDLLSEDDKLEFTFKTGYCYFLQGEFDKAFANFKQVKDSDSKYRTPALYYYAHIAYLQKNYATALVGFDSLENYKKFAPIVPYYKTHIFYYQKEYDKIISYAPQYLDKVSLKRKPELSRVVAEAYFKKQEYDKALPYFEDYFKNAQSFTKDDYYEYGYLLYRNGKYKNAREYFNKVTGESDTIAQNAYYHLADCYIRTNQKEEARNAFNAAMKYDINPEIKEDAMYSYAKLTYELSYSPFNEAIKALLEYIDLYPDSKRIDEAYTYLVKVFMSAKNYKDALASLEKIKQRNSEMNMAYQRIAYFRGLELFNNLDFRQSVDFFDRSLKFSVFDKHLKAMALYWKAEAYYRLDKYPESQKYFEEFLLSPGAINTEQYALTHYNLGYAYFKADQYEEAASWYRKYTDIVKKKSKILADAYNRTGDSYFMLRRYDQAIKYYNSAQEVNLLDADYAQFQIGFCKGLTKDTDGKINELQKLVSTYPNSTYIDDAYYELARTYMREELPDMAANNYEKIIKQFPKSSYVKKSLSDLGLIYYNKNENQKAIEIYKRVIAEYPGTPESKHALSQLETIYIGLNDVDSYLAYVQELGGFANVSVSKQDSLTYLAAEDAYIKGDCEKAIRLFEGYTDKFEEGIFSINANFYKGDCHYTKNELPQALRAFEFVATKNKNSFSEQALINAALISFKLEMFDKALHYYSELEETAEIKSNMLVAREGQLECALKLQNYQKTIEVGKKLLITDKVSDEMVRKANLSMARAYFELRDIENALIKYRTVALDVKNVEGAEAKYTVAEILFNQKQYDEAEKEILDFMDMSSPHQYWLAKSYILWGDIYQVRDELFQARITYQGIIENYKIPNDGITDIAKEKLKEVEAKENARQKEEEPVDILFGDESDSELFDAPAAESESDTLKEPEIAE